MNNISASAKAAQASARQSDGKFGRQNHPEASHVHLDSPVPQDVLDMWFDILGNVRDRCFDNVDPDNPMELAEAIGAAMGVDRVRAALLDPNNETDVYFTLGRGNQAGKVKDRKALAREVRAMTAGLNPTSDQHLAAAQRLLRQARRDYRHQGDSQSAALYRSNGDTVLGILHLLVNPGCSANQDLEMRKVIFDGIREDKSNEEIIAALEKYRC